MNKFTDKQIEILRKEFAKIKSDVLLPDKAAELENLLVSCHLETLKQLSSAEIHLLSSAAAAKLQTRQNIRSFLLGASREELEAALPTYSDDFSRKCIRELTNEIDRAIS